MDCVLFDLDGTVADTEILKAKALAFTVKHFGGEVEAAVYKSVMGQSWEAVTHRFFAHAKIEVPLSDFNPIFREKYEDLIDRELGENESVVDFIHFLKSRKVLVALVSSASPWMVQKVLTKMNLDNEFDLVVTNADVERHKPHPDGYLMALRKLNIRGEKAIAFEDSESGFAAARAAGVTVYGVKHNYNSAHDFSTCSEVFDSFESWRTWTFVTK